MVKVLSNVVKLLMVEVAGEVTGKASEPGEVAMSMLALAKVACPSGVLPMVLEIVAIVDFGVFHLVLAKYLTRCLGG